MTADPTVIDPGLIAGETPQNQAADEQFDIDQLNLMARQYATAASQNNTGGFTTAPDPKIFTEATDVGATPAVASSFGQSNEVDKNLSAMPINSSPVYTNTEVNLSQQNLDSLTPDRQAPGQAFNAQQYMQSSQKEIAGNANGAGQWKSLGEIPVANMGYWADLSTTTDTSRIKNWQSFLAARGMDYSSTGAKLSVSNTWSPDWMANLAMYAEQHFLPDALWSKNNTVKAGALGFLQQMGFSPSDLPDASSQSTRASVINNYINTLGDNSNPKQALQALASNYGADVLDQAHAQMLHPGILGDLENAAHDAFGLSPTLIGTGIGAALGGPLGGLLGGVLGTAVGALANLGVSKLDDSKGTLGGIARVLTQGQQLSGETPGEFDAQTMQTLDQMNTGVASETGLYGLLDGYQRILGQAAVAAKYMVVGAPDTGDHDPFADWSAAAGSANDPLKGLLGNDFATKNPILDNIGNFGITILDDPLSWSGIGLDSDLDLASMKGDVQAGITDPETLASNASRFTGVTTKSNESRRFLLNFPRLRDGVTQDGLKYLLDVAVNPTARAQRETVQMALNPDVKIGALSKMLGVHTDEEAQALVKARAQGLEGIVDYLSARKEQVTDPSNLVNFTDAAKAFSPDDFSRLGASRQAHLLDKDIRGQNYFGGRFISGTEGFGVVRDKLGMVGKVYGLTDDETDDLITQLAEGKPYNQINDALDGYYQKAKADGRLPKDLEDQIRSNSSISFGVGKRKITINAPQRGPGTGEGGRFYLPVKDEKGNVHEASQLATKYHYDDPATERMAETLRDTIKQHSMIAEGYRQQAVQDLVTTRKITEDQAEAVLDNPDPTDKVASQMAEEHSRLLEKGQDFVDALNGLPGRKGVEGNVPVAAFSSQFGNGIHLPANPYEVMVTRSKGLQKLERFQRGMRIDDVNNMWRMAVLDRVSTALKVNIGDDFSRLFAMHFNNSPAEAARFLVHGFSKAASSDGSVAQKLVKLYHGSEYVELPAALAGDVKRLYGLAEDDHVPFLPGDAGYKQALHHHITNILGKSPESEAYVRGVKSGVTAATTQGVKQVRRSALSRGLESAKFELQKWLLGGSPEAKEFADRQNIDLTNRKQTYAWASGQVNKFQIATNYKPGTPAGSQLFDWLDRVVTEGKSPTQKEVNDFVDQNVGNPEILPTIVGRRPYGSSNLASGTFKNFSQTFQKNVTGKLVSRTRQKAYDFQVATNRAALRKMYTPDELGDVDLEKRAINLAHGTIQRATYQYQKTVMAHMVRNVFPFWGATASMSKFWMREAIDNPFFGVALGQGMGKMQEASSQGKLDLQVPATGWIMRHLGVQNASNLTWDPASALYFGDYAGFIPSLGPLVISPINYLANQNPDIASALENAPVAGGSLFQYTGYESAEFPFLALALRGYGLMNAPGSGVATAAAGVLGTPPNSDAAAIAQQTEAEEAQHLSDPSKYPIPTQTGVQRQVGTEDLARSLGEFAIPGTVALQKPPQVQAIDTAETALDNATTEAERASVMKSNQAIAPLLAYRDYTLAKYLPGGVPTNNQTGAPLNRSDLGDWLTATYPWIAAYGATTQSNVPGLTSAQEPSTAQFEDAIHSGQLQYLNTPQLVTNAEARIDQSQGWIEYNRANELYQQALIQSGQTSYSTEGTQLYDAIMQPVLADLQENNQAWTTQYNTYSTGTTATDKGAAPLQTQALFDAIPMAPGMETPTTLAWRQLLVWQSQLTGELNQVIEEGGTTAQKNQVIDQFNNLVSGLAAKNPNFASQISQYTYKNLSDFLQI